MDAVHFRRRATPLNLSEMRLIPASATGLDVDIHVGTGFGPAGILVGNGSEYRQKDPGVWIAESTGEPARGTLQAFLSANGAILEAYWSAQIGYPEAFRRLSKKVNPAALSG